MSIVPSNDPATWPPAADRARIHLGDRKRAAVGRSRVARLRNRACRCAAAEPETRNSQNISVLIGLDGWYRHDCLLGGMKPARFTVGQRTSRGRYGTLT